MADDMDLNEQFECLKLDLELNKIYYSRRIAFLETIERLYKFSVFVSGAAAVGALVSLMAQWVSPHLSAWVGALAALVGSVLGHLYEQMKISLSVYQYMQLKSETQKLLDDMQEQKNLTIDAFGKFKARERKIVDDEPSTYQVVYLLARNQFVQSRNLIDAGYVPIPGWRKALGQYFYQTSFAPPLIYPHSNDVNPSSS